MDIGKSYKASPKAGLPPVEALLKTMLAKNMVDMVLGADAKKSLDKMSPVTLEKADDVADMKIDAWLAFDFSKNDSAAKYIHKGMNGALVSKVGAFARPCDIRALVELHKRRQVNLDNIILVGVEEHGRLDGKKLKKFFKAEKIDPAAISDARVAADKVTFHVNGKEMEFEYGEVIGLGRNCANCSSKAAAHADIKVNMLASEVIVTPMTVKGLEVLEQAADLLSFSPAGDDGSVLIKEIENKGRERQQSEIAEFRALSQEEKLKALGKCTMCGLCIRACPVCFCVDCIIQKKRKAKAIDQFTYQLNRISHIADTCVQCGRCDAACPVDLPLNIYFNDIAMKLEENYGYVAGRSLDEVTPRSDLKKLKAGAR